MRTKIISLERGVSLIYPSGVNGGAVSCLTRPEARKRISKERPKGEVDPERIRRHDEIWVELFQKNMYKPTSMMIDIIIPKRPRFIKLNLLRQWLQDVPLFKHKEAPIELDIPQECIVHESSTLQFLNSNP